MATPETKPVAAIVRRLFVSYAREDQLWAKDTTRTARSYGMEVFLDLTSIRAGADWPEALRQAIERADLVRLGWSKYAAQSEWVRREYTAALQKHSGSLLIDLLDETPLPAELAHIQAEKSALANTAAERILRDPVRKLPQDRNQPSQLLRPEYGVAPFFERVEMLEEIATWCSSAQAFSVRLYVAPAGTGKTRLSIEACQRLKHEGWEGKFLAEDALREALATTPSVVDALFWPRLPRLLIVDYAETRREQVKALLQRAVDKHDGPSVRLLLLARSAGDWWEELLGSCAEFRELVQEVEPYRLPPLAPTLAERQLLFTSALKAFAATWGQSVSSIPIVDLSQPHFSQVLYLHLAALTTLLGAARSDAGSLLDLTLEHEERYWLKAATDMKLDSRLKRELQVTAALLTLAGGCGVDQLAEVLAPDANLAALLALDRLAIADLFQQLYGFEDRVDPLQPDLLGERYITRELRKNKRLRTSWLGWSDPSWLHHGLTVLNRMTSHTPEAEGWLREILQTDLQRLAPSAIQVAIETGDPIGRILSAVLSQQPAPILASEIEPDLPKHTTALREFAAVVTTQCLDLVLEDDERARILNHLGNRLSALGRWEEALEATQETVAIYRKLAVGRPDAFLPDLAGGLNDLGAKFIELGRREEALETTQESVAIYRKLAADRPDAFLPNLAGGLNNLGLSFSDLGRREEALKASQEAVEIRRKLAAGRPDVFLADLAGHLTNLGNSFSDLGRREEAFEATQEAVAIYRKLAAARPDAFLPDLATSLNNLGSRFSDVGRVEEALKPTQEAVAIRRKLAAARPDAFVPDLAEGLNNLGHRFMDLGRWEEALEATQETVATTANWRQAVPMRFSRACLAASAISASRSELWVSGRRRWRQPRNQSRYAATWRQPIPMRLSRTCPGA